MTQSDITEYSIFFSWRSWRSWRLGGLQIGSSMDFFRKAASLLVELPPEDEAEKPAPSSTDDPLSRVEKQALDVDKLLQEQGLGTHKTATQTATSSTRSDATSTTKTVAQIAQDAAGPNLQDVKVEAQVDRKSTRLNSSHSTLSRMPSSA